MPSTDFPETLRNALVRAAREYPTRGVTLVRSRRREECRTFPELLEAVRVGAGRLAAHGVRAGDRVVVSLSTSWQWLDTWLGALWLGAIPVATAPGSSLADLRRLGRVIELLGGARVIAGPLVAAKVELSPVYGLAEAILTPEALAATSPWAVSEDLDVDPETVAFLQLTSGSTASPRAAMINHRNALHNVRAIDEATGAAHGAPAHTWIDGWVSWLPLFHDMGLVGGVLNSIAHGFDLCLMSPRRFVGDPSHWLEILGRRGTVLATAPNFGYQLCAERSERIRHAAPDLKGWRAAMVGAEMIQPDTVENFCREFEPLGFAASAMCPCYGLAEATLAVTYDQRGEGLRTRRAPSGESLGRHVASVGSPVIDTQIRITAPDGTELPTGREGEVRVKGPGVFQGYFNDPEATAQALQEGWLRTGDLGFSHDGELYLTGRLKELLIIHGHNIAPHEIEWLVTGAADSGGSHRCGAFSVSRGVEGEVPVVVLETSVVAPETLRDLEREIRLRVAHELSLSLADVVFVRRGQIPKTTSGKVQRHELCRRYLADELERKQPA